MTKYTDLIPPINRSKEKFTHTIYAITEPLDIKSINITDFDLDTAIGSQLDIVGEWIGVTRKVNIPITGVYFSLDSLNVGFDEGIWKGEHDPDYGLTLLDDEMYRLVLRAKTKANNWDGTLETLPDIYAEIFRDSSISVFPVDNQDMTMTLYVVGEPNHLLKQVILRGYLDIKPSTVGVYAYFVSSKDTQFFGFDIENKYIQGFDYGGWAMDLMENTLNG